ncbi:hypothetical protein [Nonlabens sp. Asnod2-A12]|uniref:hypothetical protein n=1 Tax=Nonlabens sp. Asnod2-A12 TaxID=3160578 RepID=UPI00387046C9
MALIALLFSCSTASKEEVEKTTTYNYSIKSPIDQVVTNTGILIQFESFEEEYVDQLEFIISGTYGTTVLPIELDNKQLKINIPKEITQHAGIINWQLIAGGKTIQNGDFKLFSNTSALKTVENYLGPRSIIANNRDYTMLVSIPVDSLDNLLPDGTNVLMQHQFKGTINKEVHKVTAGFTWQRINSPLTTGRLITGSTLSNISSTELVADVFPDIARPFKIYEDSNHNYADANEIISIKTDQIKDPNGNVMSDGTIVTFFMTDNFNQRWTTTASTVNGYAFAKALHPEKPSTWTVRGVITGMVESPEIDINFKSILKEIIIQKQERNTIIIGPLTSYLGQTVPDGIQVSLKLDGKEIILRTKKGIVSHTYDTKTILPGNYELKVESLGITALKSIDLK